MEKRKDIMKPVTAPEGKMSFAEFAPHLANKSKTGMAAELRKEDKKDQFNGKLPPFPRSVLIEKGLIKRVI